MNWSFKNFQIFSVLIFLGNPVFSTLLQAEVKNTVHADLRVEMHQDSNVDLETVLRKKSYSLLRFRLAPELELSSNVKFMVNFDLLEANAGGALSKTVYPGFSGLESKYTGLYEKNVEYFELNYAQLHFEKNFGDYDLGLDAGVMPFHFGYGMFHNNALGEDAYSSILTMNTGRVSGLLAAFKMNSFHVRAGLHTPSVAKGASIYSDKGNDQKDLLLRVDYQNEALKAGLMLVKGTGSSSVPYSPLQVGLFGEYSLGSISLGEELWLLSGKWGDSVGTSSLGSVTRLNYQHSQVLKIGLDYLFASGDNDATSEKEIFQFAPDFNPSLLLFRQVTPKNVSSGARLATFDIFNGVFSNAMAIKPFLQFLLAENIKLDLAYLLASKAANTASNKEKFLGQEVDLGVRWFLSEGFSLRAQAGLLIPGLGLDYDSNSKIPAPFKVILGLYYRI